MAICVRTCSFVIFQTFPDFLSLLIIVKDGDLKLPACAMLLIYMNFKQVSKCPNVAVTLDCGLATTISMNFFNDGLAI